MSTCDREYTSEVLTDEQLEIVCGGEFTFHTPLVISAPVQGGVGEYDPYAPRCGTHPGVIRR
jgi:hypothetical protein